MEIIVYGATGRVGSRIVAEASGRGHEITAVTRNPAHVDGARRTVVGDALDVASLVELASGHDALVAAISSGFMAGQQDFEVYTRSADTLAEASRRLGEGAPRIVIVGGAGSLFVAPGVRAVDTPDFPEFVKPEALAHADGLERWRTFQDVDWTYISPAATLDPGERTGRYQRGQDDLLKDADGVSFISMEDYAVALVDELDQPTTSRQRITVAH